LTATIATLWLSVGITRWIIMRPASRRMRDVICGLYMEIGLTPEQIHEAKFIKGMRMAKIAEPLMDLIGAPYFILRDGLSFFKPVDFKAIDHAAIDMFRKTIYSQGQYIELLETYERVMAAEAKLEELEATRH
jgi:hypothetical protein